MHYRYLIIFLVSLFVIAQELFLTRILSLKTWNHLVYLIIPFAILGYGIGANLYLIFQKTFDRLKTSIFLTGALLASALSAILGTKLLISLNVNLQGFLNEAGAQSIGNLLAAYTIVFIPFIPAGFLIVYLFSKYTEETNKLYFYDLLGAGLGAFAFVWMIGQVGVFRSVLLIALFVLALIPALFIKRQKVVVFLLVAVVGLFISQGVSEPFKYAVDKSKGWENFPDFLQPHQYTRVVNKWHPLGRTEVYRIDDKNVRNKMLENAFFKVNLEPSPKLSYVVTNYTAGTPIFRYSSEGIDEVGAKLKLFSQPFEVPYVLVDKPKTVVIGTGGGRDLFVAQTHKAQSIDAAEINPATYQLMSKGGAMFDYSGGVYERNNTRVQNIDGRHLVRTLKKDTYDLIVLTGVDTFSGLTNGAYTYAESFLYTKDSVEDYLRILNDDGILNFNRRFFPDMPREGLRLFTLSLSALEGVGVEKPWEHIIAGSFQQWCILLVKKTPFTKDERQKVEGYFKTHNTQKLFPNSGWEEGGGKGLTAFDRYAKAFKHGQTKKFLRTYPYDVSVITDDNPFFYKYYKFNIFNPFKVEYDRHTGTLIFITQIAVLAQALFFILLFIFLPLLVYKRSGVKQIPKAGIKPFITYFSCLGVGFMFIEIPLMQKFVLLLGSPIYSISVTLAALLIFTGVGSYLIQFFKGTRYLKGAFLVVAVYVLGLTLVGEPFLKMCMAWSFPARICVVSLLLFPVGLALGMFFPTGLTLIGKNHRETIAWAWGLNSGFSVLGSILSIILAQFFGFYFILGLGAFIYLVAVVSYKNLETALQ